MKIKLIVGIAAVLIVFSNSALADNSHHKDDDSSQVMPGMMSDDMPMMDMKAMHGNMRKMQKIMDRIHSSSSIKEQQKLMFEHMQEMQNGMGMMMSGTQSKAMSGHMESSKMSGNMQEKMESDENISGINNMMTRHTKMEQRMNMMQGMMNQMMQHMMQKEKMNGNNP